MLKTIFKKAKIFFRQYSSFFSWVLRIVASLGALVTVLAFLQSKNINILQILSNFIQNVSNFLQFEKVPMIIWLLLVTLLIFLIWLLRRIELVAGEFTDNFDNGLINWEFGGEGWITQRGENGYELSVTNSSDGGITNFGLWDNYAFIFECKLLKNSVGWIVRANDREHYVMIQLSMTNQKLTINPHYKVPSGWFVLAQDLNTSNGLKNIILAGEWMRVKIIVFGNTIDVFINDERILNHHIPDPIRLVIDKKYKWHKTENKSVEVGMQELESFSFPNGKVGFRCDGIEHAHIRRVKVKPLFWDSNSF